MAWYLDTSAFLKLVADEAESAALRTWAFDHPQLWSSQLLLTEAMRAAARLGISSEVIDGALESIVLVLPSARTFHAAGHLALAELRSLDAIHLATALEMGEELQALVTYDDRLAEAATQAGIPAVAPSG